MKLENIFSSNNYINQVIRYLISGVIAFLIDFGILYFCTEQLKLHYIISSIIGFSVGLFIIYIFSIYWIFNYRKTKAIYEILIFIFTGLIGILLTTVLMWVLTESFQLYFLFSKLITTVVVFIWNFLSRKLLLFSKSN
jgi:putative flippase GtrA